MSYTAYSDLELANALERLTNELLDFFKNDNNI